MDSIKVKSSEINFVIYHADCPDGIFSAISAKYLLGNNATYYPAKINQPPPDVKGKCVAICNYSYDFDTTIQLLEDTKGKLVILDHHLTAQKNLLNISTDYKYIDLTHSGAYISWVFFNKTTPPKVINFIEDHDLWNVPRKYEETEYLQAYINSNSKEIDDLSVLLDETKLYIAIVEGKYTKKLEDKQIESLKKHANTKMCTFKDKHYIVAYINTHLHKSKLANISLEKTFPLSDFSAAYSYYDNSNMTSFSLRSSDEKTDVSVIAKSFGGGRHRNACSMGVSGMHNMLPLKHYNIENPHYILSKVYEKTNFHLLNTDIFSFVWLQYLTNKYDQNICVWNLSANGCVMFFNSTIDVKSLIKEEHVEEQVAKNVIKVTTKTISNFVLL
jgi:hypothetical protein